MTFYSKLAKDGSWSVPQTLKIPGSVRLTDEQAMVVATSYGFVTIEESDGVATSVVPDKPAIERYKSEHPVVDPEPSPDDDRDDMLVDLDYRLTLLELGV